MLFIFPQKLQPQIATSEVVKISVDVSMLEKAISEMPPTPLEEKLEKIMQCESGGNPLAKNPHSSAKGLLQIIDGTWDAFRCEGNVLNARDNWRCGMKIATQSGLHHWDASASCWK